MTPETAGPDCEVSMVQCRAGWTTASMSSPTAAEEGVGRCQHRRREDVSFPMRRDLPLFGITHPSGY